MPYFAVDPKLSARAVPFADSRGTMAMAALPGLICISAVPALGLKLVWRQALWAAYGMRPAWPYCLRGRLVGASISCFDANGRKFVVPASPTRSLKRHHGLVARIIDEGLRRSLGAALCHASD